MLDRSHSSVYQDLDQLLDKLKESLSNQTSSFPHILSSIDVQAQHLQTLTPEKINPEMVSRWRSLVTETYRELKLLKTDLLFWQAARHSDKQASRRASIQERLEKLQQFQQLLQKIEVDSQ